MRKFWVELLMKKCVRKLGLVWHTNRESRKKKGVGEASFSVDLSVHLKDITVRIIHAGGREELYRKAISASQLMEKYPGMCVARPEVFKCPHESILVAGDKLFPGHKYYILPHTTAQKLKHKYSEKVKVKEPAEGKESMLGKKLADDGGDFSKESAFSAKDFSVSREGWSKYLVKKSRKGKKQYVPPIQKPRNCKELEWEPSLTSVQELSP